MTVTCDECGEEFVGPGTLRAHQYFNDCGDEDSQEDAR